MTNDPPNALPPLALPPRPLTRAASRQSWRELPVRRWTALTIGLLLVILAVGVRGVITGLDDRRLRNEGRELDGTIEVIAGARTNADRSVQREITLSFQVPGETERRVLEKQILEPEAGAPPISWGSKLPILVDRQDPRKWTSHLNPPGWATVLAVPLALSPFAIIAALITLKVRSRVLSVYTNGSLRAAKVSDAHRSPLVPGQKVVKFSIAGRSLAAVYPDALGPIDVDDAIEVIASDGAKPSHAIVARAYE